MFPIFFKRIADVLAARLSIVFRRLVHLGSFWAYWKTENVTRIPKSPLSSSLANYRSISITSVLSKTTQFAYWKGLGLEAYKLLDPWCTFVHSHTLQRALKSGLKARIIQIDFSAAFERGNLHGILYKLCSVGIGDSVLSISTQFLSNRSQNVMVDPRRSKLVSGVSGLT